MRFFSEATYIERRQNLVAQLDKGVILIMGNAEAPMNYNDNVYHFRQNSNFLYYFGIQQADLNAVIDVETGKTTIYGHENTMDDIIWLGEVAPLSQLAEQVGVSYIEPAHKLVSDLQAIDQSGRPIHYLPPYRNEHYQLLNQGLGLVHNQYQTNASISLIKAVVSQRSFKNAEEIAELTKAVNITREMHLQAYKSTQPGKYEYEAVSDIVKACKENDGSLAYGIIFSVNGQVLHNHYHQNKMNDGQLVINDSGAENDMCYAGDITRSMPVNGKFSQKQKEIYDIVYEMETSAINAVKPGVKYRDIHLGTNLLLIERFKEIGLLKGDVDEMLAQGVAGMFMPHGLGHMIGLDVHDMEDLGENHVGYEEGQERATYLGLKSLRLAKTLSVGHVLTVEPGIYFIPQLINKYRSEGKFVDFVNYAALESYLDFGGIRIEDNILVTESGSELIGEYIPKKADEVEDCMS